MEVIDYDKRYKKEWDSFVEQSNNGTIFHKIQFLDYHPQGKFNFRHLIFKQGDKIIALLPGGLSGDAYKSPLGASFGSFVVKDISLQDSDAVIKSFIGYCFKKNIKEIFITPPLIIYQQIINDSMEYSMLYNGFRYLNHLYSSVVDLSHIEGDIISLLRKGARNDVSKAEKRGICVKITDDYNSFYPILVENKKKFGIEPVHTQEELYHLHELMPDSFKLFMAYLNDKPIAGVLLFLTNKKTVLTFYASHFYEYRTYSPITYILYNVLKWTKDNGYSYLDYGVSMNTVHTDIMEPSWSLVFFKEGIKAMGCLRNTLYMRVR